MTVRRPGFSFMLLKVLLWQMWKNKHQTNVPTYCLFEPMQQLLHGI